MNFHRPGSKREINLVDGVDPTQSHWRGIIKDWTKDKGV